MGAFGSIKEFADQMTCGNCRYYDRNETSIFGGWCILGVHLQEKKNTRSGVDAEDYCRDWEAKDGEAEV